MIFENFLALLIAVEYGKSVEQSFKILDRICEGKKSEIKDFRRVHYKYSFEDYIDAKKLLSEGLTLNEVGSYYGFSRSSLICFFKRIEAEIENNI